MTVIKNLKIYTMDDRRVVENGYIAFENGKITAVGSGQHPNADEIIDACGLTATPGFIDGHTHMGIIEGSLGFEGDDCNETGEVSEPHLRALDAVNPMDEYFKEAIEAGVTAVSVSPGSAAPIGGQICTLKTFGKRVDKMLINPCTAIKFALGENPKGVYHGKNQSPETRMATAAIIRETLIKAKKYKEKLAEYENDEDVDEPEYDMKSESLLGLFDHSVKAHFHAHRADDIFTAIRIAHEFGLDYTILHCTEGYKIADELALEGTTAFVGPNLSDRSKPELSGLTFENPYLLSKYGICFGITTDHPVTTIGYLPLCASLAVKSGLEKYKALEAITVNPAKILGIDSRIGQLKAGLDADIVLHDGEPLDFTTRVRTVYVNGVKAFEA